MKAPELTEHQEQCIVVDWWDHVCGSYGLPSFALYAVPNGAVLAGDASKRARQMARLKASGLRVGILDLNLDVPVRGAAGGILIPGLRIEMKRKPNKPSKEQGEVVMYLRKRGYHVCICYSADEAMQAIKGYLGEVVPR